MMFKPCLFNQANNALTVNAGFQHRSHSNITLGIVGEPTVNDLGVTAAKSLLSSFTLEVETNVFQKSNLTQLYKDVYEDFQQIDGFVDSTFDSGSLVNNDEELKEDMDDST
jgi:hypothetical protein